MQASADCSLCGNLLQVAYHFFKFPQFCQKNKTAALSVIDRSNIQ